MTREQKHSMPASKFNWRCLFGHKWGEWSRFIERHYPLPSLDSYWWKQRKCTRCGAGQGTEMPNVE